MKLTYVVVFEKGPNNYSAYIPDLPGCVSVGRTWEEMHWMIREAITVHLEAMYEDGDPIPSPQTSVAEALSYHKETYPEALSDYPVPAAELERMGITDEPAAVLEVEVEVDFEIELATEATAEVAH